MAACKSVIVLCPNGRRQTVKVTPTTAIVKIIEEVCKKQGFSSQEYSLKHQRSVLDSTIPIRYSGLSNNAHLELVPSVNSRKDAKSTVALQLVSGERLLKDFPGTSTLWDVLHYWDSQEDGAHCGKVIQPPTASGEDSKLQPVCVYMTQELSGEEQLKKTTLHSLGLSGKRAIIRLLHREISEQGKVTEMSADSSEDSGHNPPEQPRHIIDTDSTLPAQTQDTRMEDTHPAPVHTNVETSDRLQSQTESVHQVKPEVETASDSTRKLKSQVVEGGADTGATDSKRPRIRSPPKPPLADFKFPQNTAGMDLRERSSQGAKERSSSPCDRNAVLFSEGHSTLVATEQSGDLPDSFFDVTLDDVRKMLEDLKSERDKADCTPLMTRAMREVQKELEIDRYEKVVIRIKFPDRFVLQGFFRPREKVSALFEFVKPYLENPQSKFYLYTSPPRCVLSKPDVSLFDAELCPASVVYFGSSNQKEHFLAVKHRESACSALEAEKNVAESGVLSNATPVHRVHVVNSAAAKPDAGNSTGAADTTSQSSTARRPVSNKNAPKWFRSGEKRH